MEMKGMSKHLRSPIVEVHVGKTDDQLTYRLHLSLLCEVSGFFKGCFEGNFAESKTGSVVLAENDPEVFDWFVKWAYTEQFGPLSTKNVDHTIKMLAEVYVLGDQLLCSGLKNRAMDTMQDACVLGTVNLEAVVKIVDRGYADSRFAIYSVTQIAYDMVKLGQMKKYTEDAQWLNFLTANGELTSKLVIEMTAVSSRMGKDPKYPEGCRWHEHDDDKDLEYNRWREKESLWPFQDEDTSQS